MRLCQEAIPDPDRIVACLKVKRRQVSAPCIKAMGSPGPAKRKTRRAKRRES
jgi:hypothetical protein